MLLIAYGSNANNVAALTGHTDADDGEATATFSGQAQLFPQLPRELFPTHEAYHLLAEDRRAF